MKVADAPWLQEIPSGLTSKSVSLALCIFSLHRLLQSLSILTAPHQPQGLSIRAGQANSLGFQLCHVMVFRSKHYFGFRVWSFSYNVEHYLVYWCSNCLGPRSPLCMRERKLKRFLNLELKLKDIPTYSSKICLYPLAVKSPKNQICLWVFGVAFSFSSDAKDPTLKNNIA